MSMLCQSVTGMEALTDETANHYCESIGGTPELFTFIGIRHNGQVVYSGTSQYWCNLHIKIDDTDTTDSHSYIEVKTLAMEGFNLAGYSLAHPDDFQAPADRSNPAYHYCRQTNGTLPKMMQGYSQVGWIKEGNGLNMYGGCVFGDGSTINQWTLTYAQHYRDFAKELLSRFNSSY